jgi:hypothetical protein
LPCDCGRLNACFEGGTHCIQLASSQRARAILGGLRASPNAAWIWGIDTVIPMRCKRQLKAPWITFASDEARLTEFLAAKRDIDDHARLRALRLIIPTFHERVGLTVAEHTPRDALNLKQAPESIDIRKG